MGFSKNAMCTLLVINRRIIRLHKTTFLCVVLAEYTEIVLPGHVFPGGVYQFAFLISFPQKCVPVIHNPQKSLLASKTFAWQTNWVKCQNKKKNYSEDCSHLHLYAHVSVAFSGDFWQDLRIHPPASDLNVRSMQKSYIQNFLPNKNYRPVKKKKKKKDLIRAEFSGFSIQHSCFLKW